MEHTAKMPLKETMSPDSGVTLLEQVGIIGGGAA